MSKLQLIWEYLFAPWEITVVSRRDEEWIKRPSWAMGVDYDRKFYRECVTYKYSHKFRKQEKIVKEYLN